MSQRILVVDDEESIRFTFQAFLQDFGCRVDTADCLESALQQLSENSYDTVFLDILLGRESGMQVLRASRERNPNCPVVMVTGAPDIRTAAEAVRLGAFDYLTKPVHQDELLRLAKLALAHKQLLDEQETFRQRMTAVFQGVSEGILIFDESLNLVDLNESACELLGCSSEQVGKSLAELAASPGGQLLKASRELLECRCEGDIFRMQTARADGAPLVVSLTMSPLTSAAGQENGMVLVLRDESRPVRQLDMVGEG